MWQLEAFYIGYSCCTWLWDHYGPSIHLQTRMNLNFSSKCRSLCMMSSLKHSRLQWVKTLCTPMRPQGMLRLFGGTILLIWGPLQQPIWSWRIYYLSLHQQGLRSHTEGTWSSSSQTGWTTSSVMRHWSPPSHIFLATWRKPCFRMLSKATMLSSMLHRLRVSALRKEMNLWTLMHMSGLSKRLQHSMTTLSTPLCILSSFTRPIMTKSTMIHLRTTTNPLDLSLFMPLLD